MQELPLEQRVKILEAVAFILFLGCSIFLIILLRLQDRVWKLEMSIIDGERCKKCGHLISMHNAATKICLECNCPRFIDKRCSGCRHWLSAHNGNEGSCVDCNCPGWSL